MRETLKNLTQSKFQRLNLLTTIGLGYLGAIAWLVALIELARSIDAVFLGGAELENVASHLAIALALGVIRAIALYGSERAATRLGSALTLTARSLALARLRDAGPLWIKKIASGENVATLTDGLDGLEVFAREFLPKAALAIIVPITVWLVVFSFDGLSAVVLAVAGPLLPVFLSLIGKTAGHLSQQQWSAMARLSARFLDAFQGAPSLQAHHAATTYGSILAQAADEFRRRTLIVLRVAFLSAFVLELAATLGTALVAVQVGLRLLHGHIDFFPALVVLVLAPEFFAPLRTFGAAFHAGTGGREALKRLAALPPEVIPNPHKNVGEDLHAKELSFHGVDLRYENAPEVIKNLSITIAPGERIGIAGASGAGKSTLLAALLRFIAPVRGEITWGHQSLTNLDLITWRSLLAWLPQHPHLFQGTIAENISFGARQVDEEKVRWAASMARVTAFSQSWPEGLATRISEHGTRLSGGQAQRVALARVLYRGGTLVLLDEPTAHLDGLTSSEVLDCLDSCLPNATWLVVSHEPQVLQRMQRVLFFSEGQLQTEDTHGKP